MGQTFHSNPQGSPPPPHVVQPDLENKDVVNSNQFAFNLHSVLHLFVSIIWVMECRGRVWSSVLHHAYVRVDKIRPIKWCWCNWQSCIFS